MFIFSPSVLILVVVLVCIVDAAVVRGDRIVPIIIRGSGGRCVSLNTGEARAVAVSGAINIVDTASTLLVTAVFFVSSENI